MTASQDLGQTVHQMMPAMVENLKQLVSIPSIATEGYPQEPVLEAARLTEVQLKAAGFQQVRQLQLHEALRPLSLLRQHRSMCSEQY